ncbi:MAG: PSD1 and planctomycete cytochrome C domain-containing protein, partial [Aureliella sp.]
NLMLDSATAMNAGGSRGAAIVPGKPDESWLVKALTYKDADLQMPPDGKLPDDAIEDFRKWIADGAKGAPVGGAVSASGIKRLVPEESQTHWAYRLPERTEIPTQSQLLALAKEAGLDATEAQAAAARFGQAKIDSLILAAQFTAGVTPSEPADRQSLVRRVVYDLTGLPPSAEDIAAFENDPRPTEVAYAAMVDRLLASPHFGERFARYWMDVARYADTKGYVFREEREYAQAYKYRDWLISAFNSDLPYTDFVRDQLAADKVDPNNEHGELPALGFLTLGRRFLNNKNDIIDDRLDVTTRGLMGLTLACARCHDHKYDPISQADYYSLYGVFLNTEEPGGDPWPHRLTDAEKPRESFILIRGAAGNRGAKVPRRFVSFLAPEAKPFEDGSGRAELAAKITSPDNPLTARVFVNRVWMRLMGSSLVDSPSDFGARCPAPKLQPVLDDLALDFIQADWSIKALVRSIVLSAAYQQQSVSRQAAAAVDPENSLYWRMNRRRLDFEALRDSALQVAGQLDARVGGASEKIHEAPYSRRRTVYAYIDRQNLPGVFRNFDVASPDSHSPQRLQTTVPQQGLYLLNSGFVAELAQTLGTAVGKQGRFPSDEARVTALFRQILGRSPDAVEIEAALQFVQQAGGEITLPPERWICGYGDFDPETSALKSFDRLPFTNGTAWQGGATLPDSKLGWCMLNKDGGHAGNDVHHAAVRRWTAPRDGVVSIRGKLNHAPENGDGVRATLISSQAGKLGQWTAKHSEAHTVVTNVKVTAGETLDMVTDCVGNSSHDSFQWKMRIQYQGGGEAFDSSRELPTPPAAPLTAWDQLAQALMASNEFSFVD